MDLTWAQAEMGGAEVWDHRCRRSLGRICEGLADRPLTSFSVACGPALRQAAHRIFAHPTTSIEGMLQGHYAQTTERAEGHLRVSSAPFVLLVQDTTVVDYSSHFATADLGPIGIKPEHRGLLAHSVLAVPLEGPPLGLVHLAIWARDEELHGRCREPYVAAARPAEQKESHKWLLGLRGAEAALGLHVPFLLIQDREGDVFEFLSAARQPNAQLLIRAAQPRQVLLAAPPPEMSATRQRKEACTLWEALAETPISGTMRANIPRAPGRKAREAILELRVISAWIVPPRPRLVTAESGKRKPQHVWVVQALEKEPPVGTDPIAWVLISTLAVEDAGDAEQLVHYYARRWVIEQLHLVLKSGLRIERLQFDDATSLKHALALCYVVAWRILYVRDVARFFPDLPAQEAVSEAELEVLEAVEKKLLPTVRAAVRAVAYLAGFPRYPSAGEPGVKSLWEGFRRLEGMLLGWELAHRRLEAMRQD
jgi:hypothetical protein